MTAVQSKLNNSRLRDYLREEKEGKLASSWGQVFLLREVALALWKWDNRLRKTSGVSIGSGWDLTRVKSQAPLTLGNTS